MLEFLPPVLTEAVLTHPSIYYPSDLRGSGLFFTGVFILPTLFRIPPMIGCLFTLSLSYVFFLSFSWRSGSMFFLPLLQRLPSLADSVTLRDFISRFALFFLSD